MKKHLLFIFAALLPLVASAEKVEIDGIQYNLTAETREAEVTNGIKYSGDITIPATITYEDVTYSVTSIGKDAFYYCYSLTAINITEGVTSIGSYAFRDCSSLTSITIPESLTSIGGYAFSGCTSLASIVVAEGNKVYDSRGGCNAIIETSTNTLLQGCSSTIIPEGVTSIGSSAFYDCSSPTAINIPEGVTSIGEYAFRYCSSLTSINIPESLTSIGGYAFDRCSSLTAIVVAEGNKVYDSRGGCNAIIETSTNTLLRGCSSTIIPESVTSIGESAFSGCTNLTAITLPESVTSIGKYAFDLCQNLAYISVRASVLNIGDYAFMCCDIKNFVVFSNNVIFGNCVFEDGNVYKYIDYSGQMRYNAHGAYVRIEADEITTIGDYQFRTTNSGHYLTNYIGNDTEITLPDSYLGENYKIDVAAFAGRHITSMNIPKSVDAIELYAFYNCRSLTTINIPEGVTRIGGYAFEGCSSLTAITLPESVTSIGSWAFSFCDSLTAITCHAVTPPTIGYSAFYRVDKSIPVNVPAGSVEAYKTAEYWSEFTNIRPIGADIAEGDYYLKHVGSGKFLTGANNWGTQASLGDYGISITLERLPNGKYTLDTHVANNATDHYLGGIDNTGYVDAPVAEWIISEPESGIYTLSLDGTNYWGYDGSSTVLETTLTDPTKRNAQWQLVTRAELESTLSRATLNRGIDATFLIQGHSFNRNHNENAAWMGGPVLGGPVSNFCAEKWNVTPVDVYQELAGIPNGYYTLEVQGFYRDAKDPTITAERRAMGTEQLRARLYAGDRSVALMSILDEATPEQSYGGLPTTYGWVPNTMSEAASYFASGLYPNKVDAWVTDGTLRIGIRKESGESGDWVIFDNFRLTYYGSKKPAGIEQPGTDEAPHPIYDLMGRKVTDTENLTGGIYIIGGKKVIIK